MLRIWINNAKPEHIPLIDLLKKNPDGEEVIVYASVPDPKDPTRAYPDIASTEPDLNTTDPVYAAAALEYAAVNQIDVIVPTCRVRALASHMHEFRRYGTEVLNGANDYITDICESRTDLWQVAQKWGIPVPPYRRVTSSVQFRDAVECMERRGFRAVVRPDRGSVGNYRIIRRSPVTAGDILGPSEPSVMMDEYERAMWSSDFNTPPMVVHPYLDSPELHVDVLVSPNSYSVVSVMERHVSGEYLSIGKLDPVVMQKVHTLADNLGLTYLSTMRFRHLDGQPVLTGVTPFPDPGVADTGAAGVNLLWECVRFAQGHSVRPLPSNSWVA